MQHYCISNGKPLAALSAQKVPPPLPRSTTARGLGRDFNVMLRSAAVNRDRDLSRDFDPILRSVAVNRDRDLGRYNVIAALLP